MSTPSLAVIGVGALGRHHARILANMDGVELAAVVDTREDIGTAAARQHNTAWVADYQHVIDQVDGVSIVVPSVAHLEVASAFLNAGKAVFVEKPIAASLEDAQAMAEIAAQNNCLLQVGHVERFNPATQVARQHVGNPRYIRTQRVSPYTFRSTDIGVVHDLMIHDLDLILDLVDYAPVESVEAFGVAICGQHEDTVQARVRFQNGCIADLTASRVSPNADRSLQVWSDTGCIMADLSARTVTNYQPSEALLFGKPLEDRAREPDADLEQLKSDVFGKFIRVENPEVHEQDALTAELAEFVHCMASGESPSCGADQAVAAMAVAELVLQSVAEHQWEAKPDGLVGPRPIVPGGMKKAG